MGQQQLLLIILGVIIVGIAIAVGLQLFQSGSVGANQDAMINDAMNIAAHADQWRIRPVAMGGGGGDFTDDIIARVNGNTGLMETGNATFVVAAAGANGIEITGTSDLGYGTVILTYIPNPDDGKNEVQYDWGGTHQGGIGETPPAN